MAARKVAIALDNSKLAKDVFAWALENVVRPGDCLLLLHVEPEQEQALTYLLPEEAELEGSSAVEFKRHVEAEFRSVTQPFAKECSERNLPHEVILLQGDPRDALVDACERLEVALLVLGSHGHGTLRRALLGSVSTYAIHHAHCPVLVYRQ
eukprot:CAMPEP_0114557828 /NCGR_PEP_ID=MMETSP0114-20121206/10043_1 /TAXON_ID=31324 /ORGANISM="Goniomonas sp, Strain m" /LENGTH=151 /DNA_ID=CAMNT_0001743151 /DNA_START=32 /DNA_END=487 /DNA_ORIENTATION=+